MSRRSKECVFSEPIFTETFISDQDFTMAGKVLKAISGIKFLDLNSKPLYDRYFRYNRGGGWWVGPSKYEGFNDEQITDSEISECLDELTERIGVEENNLLIREKNLAPDQTITNGSLHLDGPRLRINWLQPGGRFKLASNIQTTEFWIPTPEGREQICSQASRIICRQVFRDFIFEDLMHYIQENPVLFDKVSPLPGQVTIHDSNTIHREVSGSGGMRYLLAVAPRG